MSGWEKRQGRRQSARRLSLPLGSLQRKYEVGKFFSSGTAEPASFASAGGLCTQVPLEGAARQHLSLAGMEQAVTGGNLMAESKLRSSALQEDPWCGSCSDFVDSMGFSG